MSGAFDASLITIAIATVASWIFGSIFYMSLAKPWMAAADLTEEDIRPGGKQDPSPFIISFVLEFVMAYVLAILLLHTSDGDFTIGAAIFSAFTIWLGFIFTTQCINHRYGMRSWSLTIIDSAHWLGVLVVQAVVMALIGL